MELNIIKIEFILLSKINAATKDNFGSLNFRLT